MRRNLHPVVFFAIALAFFLPTHSQAQEANPPITVITGVSVSRADLSSFNFHVRESLLQQLGATVQSDGGDKTEPALSGEFGLGWLFNRYFAAELALGGATSIVTTQKGRLHDPTGDWGFGLRSSVNAFAVHLSLVGTLPLGEDFEVFGRLGATRQEAEVKTSLSCVEDCKPVPQHDGHPAGCDIDGKNCVPEKPDSPPTTFSRRAVFNDGASIIPVFGAGLRWHAFRVEYRAMRLPIGKREGGPDTLFANQPRLQVSGDEHTLLQTVLFTYVWGAGVTWQ